MKPLRTRAFGTCGRVVNLPGVVYATLLRFCLFFALVTRTFRSLYVSCGLSLDWRRWVPAGPSIAFSPGCRAAGRAGSVLKRRCYLRAFCRSAAFVPGQTHCTHRATPLPRTPYYLLFLPARSRPIMLLLHATLCHLPALYCTHCYCLHLIPHPFTTPRHLPAYASVPLFSCPISRYWVLLRAGRGSACARVPAAVLLHRACTFVLYC